MLSPTMTTNSNGNLARVAASCLATDNWCLSPVPVSPITANFTDPFCTGTDRFCATSAGTATVSSSNNTNRNERRIISPPASLLNRVRDEVDDDVRLDVANDQVLADDAVFELLRQLGQVPEHLRWRAGQRRVRRIHRIDLEHDGLAAFFLLLLDVFLQLVLHVGL